jgi:hypothetical protein
MQLASSAVTAECHFPINETYNWFSCLSTCQAFYREIFRTLYTGKELLRISRAHGRGWLSIEPAVARIIEQLKELKMHLDIAHLYAPRMLLGMFSDESNLVNLLLFKPIQLEVQAMNKNFESNAADPRKLLIDYVMLIQPLMKKVELSTYFVEINVLNLDFKRCIDCTAYLGYAFKHKVEELRMAHFCEEQEKIFRE